MIRSGFGSRWPLAFKLLVVTEVLLLVAIVAMLVPVRSQMREQAVTDLQEKLRAIASVAVLQLDGDQIARVRTAADTSSDAFLAQRAVLTRIRERTGLPPEHLYTLYHDPKTLVARFGVMTHERPFVGDPIPLSPELRNAFDVALRGEVSVTKLYTDQYGQWISAFAPIRDTSGRLVGLLEVDESADAYFSSYARVQKITGVIALASLGIASLLGFYVIHRTVLSPMRAVHGGMRALARQDFSHRVSLNTRDEFEDLASVLNDLSRQLNAARQVAEGFTPKQLPAPEGWRIAALTEPCEATAGDYFDAFPLPDSAGGGTAVLVADVTGHGLGPSLHMSGCRSALRALASTGLPPAELLARLDTLLQNDLDAGRFITMLYGVLSPDGRFTFCNAGHGPALLHRTLPANDLSPDAVASPHQLLSLDAHRPPLGIAWDALPEEPDETSLQLLPGDRLLLCSDGVSEAMDPAGAMLGVEPLSALLADRDLGPDGLLAALRERIKSHCRGRKPTDDVTILCVQRVAPVVAPAPASV